MLNWAKEHCEVITPSVINLTVHFTGEKNPSSFLGSHSGIFRQYSILYNSIALCELQ